MSAAGKVAVIAGLIHSLYGHWRLQRLLSGVMMVVGLTIVTSMLIGMMLIGGFYAAYFALVDYGLGPLQALLLIGLSTLLAVVVLMVALWLYMRRMPKRLVRASPLMDYANETVDAFFDGFMAEDAQPAASQRH